MAAHDFAASAAFCAIDSDALLGLRLPQPAGRALCVHVRLSSRHRFRVPPPSHSTRGVGWKVWHGGTDGSCERR